MNSIIQPKKKMIGQLETCHQLRIQDLPCFRSTLNLR